MSTKEEDLLVDYEEEEIVDAGAEEEVEEDEKKGHFVNVHSSGFRDFQLKAELMRAVVDNAFETPSEVQAEAIPRALLGMDMLCQAKSGMGKTAVFVLSTLNLIKPEVEGVSVLVLTHARELAFQIGKEYERFCKYIPGVKVGVFLGGFPESKQKKQLAEEKPNIVVGTPGRILSLVESGALNLDNLKHFILDECDKMIETLEMRAQVQKIFVKTPSNKQVMMFSATMSPTVKNVCLKFMTDPAIVAVGDDSKLTLHGLQQYYVRLKPEEKNMKLANLLDALEFNQVVIFVSKQVRARELNRLMNECNFPSTYIHGGMQQEERLKLYEDFRNYKSRILVATNLFGRGIDIDKVNVVINYDFPSKEDLSNEPPADQYLHRVGRAGRFGTKGIAISFISNEADEQALSEVQSRFEVEIPELPETIDPKTYMSN